MPASAPREADPSLICCYPPNVDVAERTSELTVCRGQLFASRGSTDVVGPHSSFDYAVYFEYKARRGYQPHLTPPFFRTPWSVIPRLVSR